MNKNLGCGVVLNHDLRKIHKIAKMFLSCSSCKSCWNFGSDSYGNIS